MIVRDYNEMKPFLPAMEMKGEPTIFQDALRTAQERLTEFILGSDLEALLEQRDEHQSDLLRRCQRIISVDAFLSSIPEMDLVLTDAGFAVINTQDMAPASKERIQRLFDTMQRKLDDNLDGLVRYLVRTSQYNPWRGTEQFARLSDGLIMTLAEFRDAAVLNPITEPAWPKRWKEFLDLNSALNVALTTTVASYISTEYADEILEKMRDLESFFPKERVVLKLIKTAIAAIAMGDNETGVRQAIKAAQYMKANPDDFPTFMASAAAHDLTLTYTDTPIFSLL